MRIGINTGLAVVTQIGGESANMTALGDTVNLASRLQTLAEPGTVLLSEATHRLVEGLVEMSFVGEHPIKGKADPQKTYRLNSIRKDALTVPRGARKRVPPRKGEWRLPHLTSARGRAAEIAAMASVGTRRQHNIVGSKDQ